MPQVKIRHTNELPAFFKERGLTLKNSLPGLIRQAGRLCAVSLAFQTQPFGDGALSEAIGKVAVTRDIYKVYTTPGEAFDDIKDNNLNAARGFWKAVKARHWDMAQRILKSDGTTLKFTTIQQFDGGANHRQLRNNRGRITGAQKPTMIVQNTSALKTYVATEAEKVGAGKGGWATCARALGGIRGIPRWISKHGSPGSVIENYGTEVTKVTLINQVPYASSILSPSQKAEAVGIAVQRLFRSLKIAARGQKVTQI